MANTKTSDESAAATLTGAELIRGVQSAANVKILISAILTYISSILRKPVATISASEIDWTASVLHAKTLAANTTFTFANDADGLSITVAITNTASNYTVTWPVGVLWSGAITPVQTVGAKTDIYVFKRIGAVIYGSVIQNF